MESNRNLKQDNVLISNPDIWIEKPYFQKSLNYRQKSDTKMFNIAFFTGTNFGRKCTGLKSKEVVESINTHQEIICPSDVCLEHCCKDG